MGNTFMLKGLSLMLLLTLFASNVTAAGNNCDQIIGTWMSEEKNIVVQVYKDGETFKAEIVWFDDSDDKSKPMETRVDDKNPDKSLRSRKILGMNILKDLVYVPRTNTWENGLIYDGKNGREWNAAAAFDSAGALKVTGYWHFKFIGRTMKFKRISPDDKLLTSR